ncbi:hypothetical protein BJ165DRAFT_1128445 [Panaeolus papilionaceus]|nr:hypothetical protein BJ165DRAFT_1128445 [Panaeolus papilionaceus]
MSVHITQLLVASAHAVVIVAFSKALLDDERYYSYHVSRRTYHTHWNSLVLSKEGSKWSQLAQPRHHNAATSGYTCKLQGIPPLHAPLSLVKTFQECQGSTTPSFMILEAFPDFQHPIE